MLEILDSYKEGIELIIQILILIAVYLGLIALKFQKKEVHFSTVQKCIDNHRDIFKKPTKMQNKPQRSKRAVNSCKRSSWLGQRRIILYEE